jgi:hypothetical protein
LAATLKARDFNLRGVFEGGTTSQLAEKLDFLKSAKNGSRQDDPGTIGEPWLMVLHLQKFGPFALHSEFFRKLFSRAVEAAFGSAALAAEGCLPGKRLLTHPDLLKHRCPQNKTTEAQIEAASVVVIMFVL